MHDVLYVIGPEQGQTVKIGVSNKPTRRLQQIQLMSPAPLRVLWSTPGSYDLEDILHRRFSEYRSHGEWFTFPAPWEPVELVENAVNVLRFAVDEQGKRIVWSSFPISMPEEYLHGWLNNRLRRHLYHRSFTFPEAAEVIGAPLSFVERYGAKLDDLGWIVDQRVTRNGHRVFYTTWDFEDRIFLYPNYRQCD